MKQAILAAAAAVALTPLSSSVVPPAPVPRSS